MLKTGFAVRKIEPGHAFFNLKGDEKRNITDCCGAAGSCMHLFVHYAGVMYSSSVMARSHVFRAAHSGSTALGRATKAGVLVGGAKKLYLKPGVPLAAPVLPFGDKVILMANETPGPFAHSVQNVRGLRVSLYPSSHQRSVNSCQNQLAKDGYSARSAKENVRACLATGGCPAAERKRG